MATALFETGAGSGLSFGSLAAWRQAGRKRQKVNRSSLVGADFIGGMIAAALVEERASPAGRGRATRLSLH